MKIILTALLFFSFSTHAGFTVKDLLQSCHKYQEYVINSTEDENINAFAQECISYIYGALDKIALFYQQNDKYDAYICWPDDITAQQIFSVVYKNLLETEETRLKYSAAGAVGASIAKAYPCNTNK